MWMTHISRFLQVGAVGLLIDAGLLWLLVYPLDWTPIWARVVSYVVTITVTFVLNAKYTFTVTVVDSSFTRYALVQGAGAAINLLSYSWLVLSGPLAGRPLWALVAASALGSTHNFIMMRSFVFDVTDRSRSASRSIEIPD